MGNPRITYGSKTIDLPGKHWAFEVAASPLRNPLVSLEGRVQNLTSPRVDINVVAEWQIESAALLTSCINLEQAALRGEEWTLAIDSDKTVDTKIALEASTGDTTVYVDQPVGITAGQVYKVIQGQNYQLVTVDTVSGDLVTITSGLDFDVDAGAIFRDEFYFPAVLRDSRQRPQIEVHRPGDGQIAWRPTKFLLKLDFFEDVSEDTGMIFKALSGNASGSDSASAQPWFPSAGSVSVAANTTYFFDGYLRISRSAGTTSHTTSVLFGGTATLTSIAYKAWCNTGDTVANIAENAASSEAATALVVKAASTSATEQIAIRVQGTVRVNAAGTFIPQFQYSAIPGGAPSILANSFFRMWPEGSGSVTSRGTWA